MGKCINQLDNPLLLYTKMMRDATPGKCEYGSLLEAYAFAEINDINLLFIKLKIILSTT